MDADTWPILGVNVQAWRREEAVQTIDALFAEQKMTRVAFANGNMFNHAARNPELQSALKAFTVVSDGIGADIAARILFGRPFPANLNGTDFVPFYLENTINRHRIFLVGTRPEVIEAAARKLGERFSDRHEIVGYVDGFSGVADPTALMEKIAASGAELLLVGMGNPKQELWIAEWMQHSGVRLAFGVGALLDFTAGEIRRAPVFVRKLRLEWAYRLANEPRRLFRRYVLETPIFLGRVLRQKFEAVATSRKIGDGKATASMAEITSTLNAESLADLYTSTAGEIAL